MINDAELMPAHKVLAPAEELFAGVSTLSKKIELIRFRVRKVQHYGIRCVKGQISLRFPSELFDQVWTLLRPNAAQPVPEEELWWLAGIASTLDDKKVVEALPWKASWLARTEGTAGPRTLVRATDRPPSPIV